jgi:hypothetical protein
MFFDRWRCAKESGDKEAAAEALEALAELAVRPEYTMPPS